MNRHMVPPTVFGITGNASRDPFRIGVIPDIPFVAACDAALSAPYLTDAILIHVDVKFQNLRDSGIRYIEVGIISEVVQGRNQCSIGVGQILG